MKSTTRRFRPRVELLEAREVPSIFTVNRLADDALAGSLRWAITQANEMPGDDIIDFQPGLAGTIQLASALPALSSNIDLQGPGAAVLTVRRPGLFFQPPFYRIFTVAGGTTVSISGLTISNGRALDLGGGIFNSGTLTVSNSTISDNSAFDPTGDTGAGGGIYNDQNGMLTISNTVVSRNGAQGAAGIYNRGTLLVSGSTINSNSNGGITNGDIGALTATLTVINSTISGNEGEYGGGISNAGVMTVSTSSISGNSAYFGGGILNSGTATVSNSAVSGNRATSGYLVASATGGGILNHGSLTLINSTVSGNSALEAKDAGAEGGGIYNSNTGTLTLNYSTVAGNSAVGVSAGIYCGGIGGRGTRLVRNTILAGNVAPTSPDLCGSLGSLGHNLIGNPTGGSGYAPTDLLGVDPLLGPLQDNGGPTFTHALLPGSPALDAGDNTDAPEFDQRGLPRIVGGRIDIGAFEVQPGPVARFFLYPFVATVPSGAPVDLYVVALDAYGHLVADYAGDIYLVSTDPAVAPVSFTFRPEDGGIAHLTDAVTFRTPGPQLLLAVDAAFTALGLALYDVE